MNVNTAVWRFADESAFLKATVKVPDACGITQADCKVTGSKVLNRSGQSAVVTEPIVPQLFPVTGTPAVLVWVVLCAFA